MTEEQIIQVITDTNVAIITEYAMWHAVSAAAWLKVGFAILFISLITFIMGLCQSYDKGIFFIVALVLTLMGIIMLASNYPTVTNPKAYAIHQLITDVRRRVVYGVRS